MSEIPKTLHQTDLFEPPKAATAPPWGEKPAGSESAQTPAEPAPASTQETLIPSGGTGRHHKNPRIPPHGHRKSIDLTSDKRVSSPTYVSWRAMLNRCYREKTPGFERYGGRGVIVCDRWRRSFVDFLADMGERPEGKTLDRWPNRDGNYEPGNCRWATPKEQSANRAAARLVTFGGQTKPISQWARELGMGDSVLARRLAKGASPEAAFAKPVVYTRDITLNGETHSLAEWARRAGIKEATLRRRIDFYNWPLEEALKTPTLKCARRFSR